MLKLLERENIAEKVDMDCRGVIEVIAKEVDDGKDEGNSRRKQQQQQESEVPVDRPGRPPAVSELSLIHI